MTDKTLGRLQVAGWIGVLLGLVVIVVTAGRPTPEGWALLLGFGLMIVGAALAGLRYIRG